MKNYKTIAGTILCAIVAVLFLCQSSAFADDPLSAQEVTCGTLTLRIDVDQETGDISGATCIYPAYSFQAYRVVNNTATYLVWERNGDNEDLIDWQEGEEQRTATYFNLDFRDVNGERPGGGVCTDKAALWLYKTDMWVCWKPY